MSELATRILNVIREHGEIGWTIGEGELVSTMKKDDPAIVQLYRFPHEVDVALRELQQQLYIEKHPIFPDWKILKLK